jgi:methyl-accepting chemotaxis protein
MTHSTKNLGIRAKILLGMLILMLGYLASIAVTYVVGIRNERQIERISSVYTPLALKGQITVAKYDNSVKNFADASMTGDEEQLKLASENILAVANNLREMAALQAGIGITTGGAGDLVKTAEDIGIRRKESFKLMSDANASEASRQRAKELPAISDKFAAQLAQLSKTEIERVNAALVVVSAEAAKSRSYNLWLSVIVMACAGSVMFLIIRSGIIKPINGVISHLIKTSSNVDSAATSVGESGNTLSQGSSEQAASLEETSASLEEIAGMARRNAEHSGKAKAIAGEARSAVELGTTGITDMQTAMREIKTSSDSIGKVVKAIDEIAFQTNILALNAAVEAARAGEAGAGFAVVADEVRNLAQRSAQAARETASMIEDSIVKSGRGVEICDRVAVQLKVADQKVREVDALVGEINTASQEQSTGVTEVNRAVTQLEQLTQKNAASAEESAATVHELTGQAGELRDCIEDLHMTVYGNKAMEAESSSSAPSAESRKQLNE